MYGRSDAILVLRNYNSRTALGPYLVLKGPNPWVGKNLDSKKLFLSLD